MREVQITGYASSRGYTARDTGQTWNGSPVLAFTGEEIRAYIEAGDGEDANGYGLRIEAGSIVDRCDEDAAEEVPTIQDGATVLYVPAGRIWEVAP